MAINRLCDMPNLLSRVPVALALVTIGLMPACGGTAPEPADPHGAAGSRTGEPADQQLDPMVVAGYSTAELLHDLEQGRTLLLADELEAAAKAFDRLAKLAGDPALKALATYNGGLAQEGMGKREAAIERFERLATRYPEEGVTKNALVRLTRLYGYLERWPDLARAADRLLARGTDLPVMNLIEGHGAKALALVEQGQVDAARVALSKAQALIDKHGFGRAGAPPVQLAQVAFADGEIIN